MKAIKLSARSRAPIFLFSLFLVFPVKECFAESDVISTLRQHFGFAEYQTNGLDFKNKANIFMRADKVDTDGDGVVDHIDGDDDNDGVLDINETDGGSLTALHDPDFDKIPSIVDLDSNGDGIPDSWQSGRGYLDLDVDGRIDDVIFTDVDGNGVHDSFIDPEWSEYYEADDLGLFTKVHDFNNNGTPDFLEPPASVLHDIVVLPTDSDADGLADIYDPYLDDRAVVILPDGSNMTLGYIEKHFVGDDPNISHEDTLTTILRNPPNANIHAYSLSRVPVDAWQNAAAPKLLGFRKGANAGGRHRRFKSRRKRPPIFSRGRSGNNTSGVRIERPREASKARLRLPSLSRIFPPIKPRKKPQPAPAVKPRERTFIPPRGVRVPKATPTPKPSNNKPVPRRTYEPTPYPSPSASPSPTPGTYVRPEPLKCVNSEARIVTSVPGIPKGSGNKARELYAVKRDGDVCDKEFCAIEFNGWAAMLSDGTPNNSLGDSNWQKMTWAWLHDYSTGRKKYFNTSQMSCVVAPWNAAGKTLKGGDFVRVTYKGRSHYGVICDKGPSSKVGEISTWMAKKLGGSGNPNTGTLYGVEYCMLPGTGAAYTHASSGQRFPADGRVWPKLDDPNLWSKVESLIQSRGSSAFRAARQKNHLD